MLVSRSFISTLDIHPPGSPDRKRRARFDRGKMIFIDPAPTFDGEKLMQLASYLVRASARSTFDDR